MAAACGSAPSPAGGGRDVCLAPHDVAEVAAALAAGGEGSGGIPAGSPLALGGVHYILDFTRVPADDRPLAIPAAGVALQALAPGGPAASLGIGTMDAAQLKRATRVRLIVGPGAEGPLDRLNGVLPVRRTAPGGAGGSAVDWSVPVRISATAPHGAAEFEVVGLDTLPTVFHRAGLVAAVLAKVGVVAQVVAAFHPTTIDRASGAALALGRRVRVWAFPPAGASFAAVLPRSVALAGGRLAFPPYTIP